VQGVTGIDALADALRTSLGELDRDATYARVVSAWKSYSEAAEAVAEEAAIMHSGGFLPRECRACARFNP
jgi:hypothetical protein